MIDLTFIISCIFQNSTNVISRPNSSSVSSLSKLSATSNDSLYSRPRPIHALNRSNSVSGPIGSTTTSISVFHAETVVTNRDGRMRERALSDSDRNQRNQNSSRYKTELCRPFEESGSCKYGDKCQFAHGEHELRSLSRHPKYKTELCRTYHTVGFCPYGPRCHFIHNPEERRLAAAGPPPALTNNNLNLNKRDGGRPDPKLMRFPSAPVGLSTGGDLTPPLSICDSPNPLTSPTNFFSDEAQEFLASLAAASALSGINNGFIGQDLPLLSPGPLSPSLSSLQSPLLPFNNLQLNDLDLLNAQDNVFFPSPDDVTQSVNANGLNGYRPPSPPDSLSDPESLADSLGPASPLPPISLPNFTTPQIQPPPMQSPPSQLKQQQQPQSPPAGRLPIFRGISMEERF